MIPGRVEWGVRMNSTIAHMLPTDVNHATRRLSQTIYTVHIIVVKNTKNV